MAVNMTAIRDLLYPGINKVTLDYNLMDDDTLDLFEKRKATQAVERKIAMAGTALPTLVSEGAPTQFENGAGQRWIYNMEPYQISSGFAVTEKAVLNNLYERDFKLQSLDLKDNFAQLKIINAANILNNCTTQMSGLGGDNVSLASVSHPTDGGVWANTFPTQLDLNEASLQAAIYNMELGFVNERNIRIHTKFEQLVVPTSLRGVAERLMTAEGRPGTFSNDPNLFRGGHKLEKEFTRLQFLTSQTAWFLKTDHPGLVWYEHQPFQTHMWVDDITDNLLVKGKEYYGFFYDDPRCIFASTPST